MINFQNIVNKLNRLQQNHKPLAIAYAVIKKSGDDNAGHQAALLTYYSFLSLFPLLLVLTTITNAIIGSHPDLAKTVTEGVTSYFPLLGNQLSSHVHTLHRSGLALVAGLAFAFYGTRGVADAFQHGIQDIWQIPASQRDGFPKSLFKSLSIIIVGGLGFIVASISAGMASSAGHGMAFRGLSILINVFILYWLFIFLLNFSLPKKISGRETQTGAIISAIGLVALQYLGVYILGRELKNLDALYSYFAIALGLMFWLYLQAQMIYLAAQISVVTSRRLWPRSLDDNHPTDVDKRLGAKTFHA